MKISSLLQARHSLNRFIVMTAASFVIGNAAALTFPVTVPGDGGGAGTLRSQITAALNNGPGNTVTFSSLLTVTSIGLGAGELVINKNLTIQGPGATNMLVFNNSGRVFHITGATTATISGLTLTGTLQGAIGTHGTLGSPNGGSGESVDGGAVLNEMNSLLILTQCVMSNCTAIGGNGGDAFTNQESFAVQGDGGPGGAASGGALANFGDCFLSECTFVNDSSLAGVGGKGHDNGKGGDGGEADGGAVQDQYGNSTISVINCTFNGNSAIAGTGGIGGDAFLGSPNPTAGGAGGKGGDALGGALYVFNGCPDSLCDGVNHCTISGNLCGPGFGGLGGAGADAGPAGATGSVGRPEGCGLFFDNAMFLPIGNSIIAGNFSAAGFTAFGPDVGGPFPAPAGITSNNHNLIGAIDGSSGWLGADLRGSIAAGLLNPLLGPLQINHGQTPTMAPLACSLAIDAGTAQGQVMDQTGQSRTVVVSAIVNGGDGTDIGAYELQSFPVVKLNIAVSNGNIILSWPAPDDSCFILQDTTSLVPPVQWNDANNQVNVVGNQNQVVIPLPMNGNLFFRLRHP